MTTQPELPDYASAPARPALYVAPPPPEHDVDFDGFVRSYEARLRRLVLRRIGDLSEAEEITQETLLRAYQHRATFATEDELMAWSTVVAQRLVIDRVRVRGRSVTVSDVPETSRLGRDTAGIVVARHEARAALESLEAIPTRQAAILWAREVEGLHYDEIADRFGITEPAVRSLLHRGRKALRTEFKNRTGSLPLNGLVPFAPWLLALKAAGKVRGAAKTVAKSSVTTAAALSISALVATTGLLPFGADRDGGAPAVRIDAGRQHATYVRSAADPAEAVQRLTATGHVRRPSAAAAPARPTDTKQSSAAPLTVVPRVSTCVEHGGRCLVKGGQVDELEGGEIQVGPDLPPGNPLGIKNVVVASDYIDCRSVPATPVTKCTQNSPAQQPVQPGTTVSPAEGALR